MLRMPLKRTSKWIVVTSIQAPTDDIMRLASYPDWTLVVVGDEKTPNDWNLTDVHFLSLDIQAKLGFASVHSLPTKSYTRKNAGYLYAIANGAYWIYDTDDDNKPFGKGLDQFDYSAHKTRGLRFTALEKPYTDMQYSLFNPYRHFGRPDMWPRGFPLEHIKDHDHLDGSYRLCRVQHPPAVQQGIVQKDPDVDAIYRLIHADPVNGLDESFSPFAPPVILAPGTYAPWNSQNTLFAQSAFFGLFLPTTVAFRVTDIWRSYFTQALLHAIGESISFVPVNAIQRRNAHNYLKDFDQEIDVYNKSGRIVQFIKNWTCAAETMDNCTIELAERFAEHGFWGKEDAQIIRQWVDDLKSIGYTFPPLRHGGREDYPIGDDSDQRRNCRRAHIALTLDLPMNASSPARKRASDNINNFGDLKAWCGNASANASKVWDFPSPDELSNKRLKNKTLSDNYQTVAIISNNWQWSMSMGLLQRLYEANFAMLIFCGHYPKQSIDAHKNKYPDGMASGDSTFPNLRRPINYIDLSNEEVRGGYLMYYCLAKVEEMKIQNVKGYVMFSDDLIFNFWNPLNLNLLQGCDRGKVENGPWWPNHQYGFNAMSHTIQLIKDKYKTDPEVALFTKELEQTIIKKKQTDFSTKKTVTDVYKYLMIGDGWVIGDWIYVPSSNISFVGMFAQLAHEGELFHELFVSKLLYLLPSEGAESIPKRFVLPYGAERNNSTTLYNASLHGLHPIKPSSLQNLATRSKFCDSVLETFHQNIF